jgi:hypothetical protein
MAFNPVNFSNIVLDLWCHYTCPIHVLLFSVFFPYRSIYGLYFVFSCIWKWYFFYFPAVSFPSKWCRFLKNKRLLPTPDNSGKSLLEYWLIVTVISVTNCTLYNAETDTYVLIICNGRTPSHYIGLLAWLCYTQSLKCYIRTISLAFMTVFIQHMLQNAFSFLRIPF